MSRKRKALPPLAVVDKKQKDDSGQAVVDGRVTHDKIVAAIDEAVQLPHELVDLMVDYCDKPFTHITSVLLLTLARCLHGEEIFYASKGYVCARHVATNGFRVERFSEDKDDEVVSIHMQPNGKRLYIQTGRFEFTFDPVTLQQIRVKSSSPRRFCLIDDSERRLQFHVGDEEDKWQFVGKEGGVVSEFVNSSFLCRSFYDPPMKFANHKQFIVLCLTGYPYKFCKFRRSSGEVLWRCDKDDQVAACVSPGFEFIAVASATGVGAQVNIRVTVYRNRDNEELYSVDHKGDRPGRMHWCPSGGLVFTGPGP